MNKIEETAINIIAEGTRLEGKIEFDAVSRVHGVLSGEIIAKEESILILCETSQVDGSIRGNIVMIDGYVRGDITATTRVTLSRTGRVIGNIKTPTLIVEFGGYFEGRCAMESSSSSPSTSLSPNSNLTPSAV